jgi:dimethylamine/trimethylamine dehydrogenase
MTNVKLYLESALTKEHIHDFGADHVVLATGATWRRDGVGRALRQPIYGTEAERCFSPDDIMDGKRPPRGSVVIFDDDHYYMGSVMAELLASEGYKVTLATPGNCVSSWSEYTLEQGHIERRILKLEVEILPRHLVKSVNDGVIELVNTLTGNSVDRAGFLVPVTMRLPNDELYYRLTATPASLRSSGIKSVRRIGDCYGPATIAAAVYEGRRYAEDFDREPNSDGVPFKTVRHVLELGG